VAANARTLDKRRSQIQSMFTAVAPRYDLLNRLLSARRDVAWRRAAADALAPSPASLILDLCCGTGDQALAVHDHRARVLAADFSLSMLLLADQKFAGATGPGPWGLAGDTLDLPFATGRFAGVTVSFGLRNVEDLEAALTEMYRILNPGGRTAILEFATPVRPLLRRIYLLYFLHLLPRIGRWLSPRGSAYRYLTDSVMSFPQRQAFTAAMTRTGFINTAWQDLSGGIVCLYTGTRPT
jgi:demethylmenaquinone methyltransferase/2-methoxy-6-polyprenyl-1,4-benzoquinol methylase